MEKETDTYRVFDERFPEFDLMTGTHLDCMQFMVENYEDEDPDFNYVWVEESH